MTEARAATANAVHLVGRMGSVAVCKVLPSGDSMVSFRVVVDRPHGRGARSAARSGGRVVTVDAVECMAWRAAVRRSVSGWSPGDVVEVNGSLRRRFWRGPAGPGSRTEVEVEQARRLRRAG